MILWWKTKKNPNCFFFSKNGHIMICRCNFWWKIKKSKLYFFQKRAYPHMQKPQPMNFWWGTKKIQNCMQKPQPMNSWWKTKKIRLHFFRKTDISWYAEAAAYEFLVNDKEIQIVFFPKNGQILICRSHSRWLFGEKQKNPNCIFSEKRAYPDMQEPQLMNFWWKQKNPNYIFPEKNGHIMICRSRSQWIFSERQRNPNCLFFSKNCHIPIGRSHSKWIFGEYQKKSKLYFFQKTGISRYAEVAANVFLVKKQKKIKLYSSEKRAYPDMQKPQPMNFWWKTKKSKLYFFLKNRHILICRSQSKWIFCEKQENFILSFSEKRSKPDMQEPQ